jgi:hypothetical protein
MGDASLQSYIKNKKIGQNSVASTDFGLVITEYYD